MLEVIVFLCGAVVMVLEMVGSRILAPYLGTSIVVWTSLIGIILGCLSLGYWWGGKLADERPSWRILSHIILLAAFFIGTLALTKSFILSLLQQYVANIHIASTAATILLFAPPSILLGMVSPYSVRLKMSDVEKSGSTVGSLYAISTMGSIFGTFLAGFFLIAFFGSTNILLVLSSTLVLTSLIASRRDVLIKLSVLALIGILFLGFSSYDRFLAGHEFHDFDTNYNKVLVYKAMDDSTGRPVRVMVTNPHGKQSAMFLDDDVEMACRYTCFYTLAQHFHPNMKKVLMLGGGGYSFPKYALLNYPSIEMDVVEIDPQITHLARRFFSLKNDPRLSIYHEDARTFLNKSTKKYDVVLGDTFNSHYSIPFHVSTVEAVRRLHDMLEDDGVVLANVLSSIKGDSGRFLRAEYATFKSVFPQVYLFPVAAPRDGERWQNIMLVALKSHSKPSFESDAPEMKILLSHLWKEPIEMDLPVLTDDFAPVDRYTTLFQ
jgi:spermidine synthase